MSDWRPAVSRDVIVHRAELLRRVRQFFHERQVIEVDTPVLSASAVTDPNIHSLRTRISGTTSEWFLHTSPEFPMKRLLASGAGDIYQVCKVFRQGEIGRNHNPEFSMLEWYRCGFDHHQLMDEMAELLGVVADSLSVEPPLRISYHEAFARYGGIEVERDLHDLEAQLMSKAELPPQGLADKTEWLDWALGVYVAPGFPTDRFTFLYDYPADQAALARIREDNPRVAERFEVFFGEMELANGFHELIDGAEQLSRFEDENTARNRRGMDRVPIDHHFIEALDAGMPHCSGVAMGLDRLLMVLLKKDRISDVITFDINRA